MAGYADVSSVTPGTGIDKDMLRVDGNRDANSCPEIVWLNETNVCPRPHDDECNISLLQFGVTGYRSFG